MDKAIAPPYGPDEAPGYGCADLRWFPLDPGERTPGLR